MARKDTNDGVEEKEASMIFRNAFTEYIASLNESGEWWTL
jgi:hypothetical protein